MEFHSLTEVLEEVLGDLPWSDHVRLIVGPLAGRETVKDKLLERTPVIAAGAGTLLELANEILKKSKVSVDNSLTSASQADALERVAASPLLRSAVPDLCTHLKSRQVSLKIARFLSHFDRYYVHTEELDAVVDYLQSRDASLGAFTRVVVTLWKQGELTPWGDGHVLRKALECLGSGTTPLALPEKIWLWGFFELTPLEETFLEALARQGVALKWLVPPAALSLFENRARALRIETVALTAPEPESEIWEPHSVWDEVEFLRDELERLRAAGIAWRDIAIQVPADELYKRLLRQKLTQWNVPIFDPTLSGAWKDNADWLWWRDLLRVLASGLKTDDVRAWLGPGEGRHELFEQAFADGVHGGASAWAKLAKKRPLPELTLLVEGVAIFGRAMAPADFLKAIERLVPRVTELLGPRPGSERLLEFARHIAEDRPYLAGFRGRLPRYLPLFEEFLEAASRTLSVRAIDGVKLVGHGVWLPERLAHCFVLGANTIRRARPSADLWDWEALEVRRLWDKLHFGLTYEERVARDEAFLLYGLQNHGRVVYSGCDYELGGAPLPKGALFQQLKAERKPVRRGGHEAVGWVLHRPQAASNEPMARPDLAPKLEGAKGIRVSNFEDYLKCPFVYFGRYVLELDTEDELGLDPDGRARGNVLHKVLERMLAEEISGHALADLETARRRVRELVDEEVDRSGLTGMYRHKPLTAKAKSVIRSHAEKWLEWELANRAKHPALKPFAVEKPIELELDGGLKVRGKADRIDSDGKHAVVIDYKSGSAPLKGKELQQGIGAQLLMYSRGIEIESGLEPAAAYYLTIGNKIQDSSGIFLKKHQKVLHSKTGNNSGLFDGEFSTLFEKVSENWTRAAENLLKGDFAPRPARPKDDCPNCRFKPVCGFVITEEEA